MTTPIPVKRFCGAFAELLRSYRVAPATPFSFEITHFPIYRPMLMGAGSEGRLGGAPEFFFTEN